MNLIRHSQKSDDACASKFNAQRFQAFDLVELFNQQFGADYNTVLVAGAEEPLYQPASQTSPQHIIYFRYDYFASALHEVAHWCIAGEQRRKLTDYGYWYAPDGRDMKQQAAFESVEVKPQALEMAFSLACNKNFRVSIDNLSSDASNDEAFASAVLLQFETYKRIGFPFRAQLFLNVLHDFYETKA